MTTTAPTLDARNANRIPRWPVHAITLTALSLLPACSSPSAFLAQTSPTTAATVEYTNPPTQQRDSGTRSVEHSEARAGLSSLTPADSVIRTAVLTQDVSDEAAPAKIIPLSHQAVAVEQDCEPHCFTPAEARIDPAFGRMSPADMYPDEYLADGGDRRLPVHYFAGNRQGFDTEDTIAEYSDHHGKSHVRASNRVAVYAPRFGSVQVTEGAGSGTQIHHAVKTTEFSAVGSLERQDAIQQSVTEDGYAAVRSRRRADGAEAQRNAIHSQAATRAQQNDKIDQGLQAEAVSGMQILEREQGPHFHEELANAAIWSRDLFPQLSASTAQAGQVRTRLTAQATVGIDDLRAKKSDIHLVKLADRETAEAGDTIHFTIRYINTGDYDLHNVRIVDNLTPRLQFVPDSVQTDRDGDVITEPNGEGSEIISFVLDEPLAAHQSGTIEFTVRVK